MKKVFVSMMLAGALLAGNTAFAQSQTDGITGATTQKESCENCGTTPAGQKSGKAKKGQKGKKGSKGKKGQKGNKPNFNPFDGIQLTPDQQKKLEVLQQGLGPVELTPQQQAQIPVNPNLTDEQKKQLKEERKARKMEAKKTYLKGVKETLTPEQYVIFLENVYLYSPIDQYKDKGMRQGAPGRHVKK